MNKEHVQIRHGKLGAALYPALMRLYADNDVLRHDVKKTNDARPLDVFFKQFADWAVFRELTDARAEILRKMIVTEADAAALDLIREAGSRAIELVMQDPDSALRDFGLVGSDEVYFHHALERIGAFIDRDRANASLRLRDQRPANDSPPPAPGT